MFPEERAIVHNFGPSLLAINLLYEQQLTPPFLVLVYATIDAAASLTVSGNREVARDDFIAWVDRYLLPDSALPCTSIDLYAARCGILHALSPLSRLSQQGKARSINYAWGTSRRETLDASIVQRGRSDIVAVHMDDLRNAIHSGVRRFFDTVAADAALAAVVRARTDRLFVQIFSDQLPGSPRSGAPDA